MKINTINDDLIERYLDHTLPRVERELFDERLKTDPTLSKELADRIMLQKSWVKVTMHNQVKQHIGQVITIEKLHRKILTTRWLAAASLVVIVGIGSMFFLQNSQNAKDREFLLSSKGISKDIGEKMIQGQQNEEKKYGSADSLAKYKSDVTKRYSPADHAVFNTSDTILFSWPANGRTGKLIIFDQKELKVLEQPIQTGLAEYKLQPSRLNPGTYTWSMPADELKHSFSIKK
jgi:hypothetical protein